MSTEKEAPPAGEGIAYDDRFCAICGSARHDWRSFVIGEGDSARICDSCLHDLGCDIEWRERAEKAESDLHREAERRAEVERERDRQRVALDKINVIRNSIVSIQGFNFSEHAYPLVAALNEAGIEGKPYPADREYLGSLIDQRDAAIAERDDARQQLASLASAARELVAALPHCTAVLDAANTVCGKPGLRRERVDIGFEDRCDEHLEGPYFSNGYSSELKRLLSQLSALDSAGGEGEKASAEAAPISASREGDGPVDAAATTPKTAALFTPEMVEAITAIEFGGSDEHDRMCRAEFFCNEWHSFKTIAIDEMVDDEYGTREQAIRRAFELSRGGGKDGGA